MGGLAVGSILYAVNVFYVYFQFQQFMSSNGLPVNASQDTQAALTKLISSYNHGNFSALAPLDSIQLRFKCCGASDAADYTLLLPLSCCPNSNLPFPLPHLCQRSQAYAHGCYALISKKQAGLLVNLVSVSTFLVTIVACTLALAYKLRQMSKQLRAELSQS